MSNAVDISNLDAPMILLVIVVTLFASALSGLFQNFGWRSTAERDAKLAVDLSKLGGMDDEVELLKASISRKVHKSTERDGAARGIRSAFAARIPELLMSTAITIVVYTPFAIVLGNAGNILLFAAASFAVGLVIQVIAAVYATRKNGDK